MCLIAGEQTDRLSTRGDLKRAEERGGLGLWGAADGFMTSFSFDSVYCLFGPEGR